MARVVVLQPYIPTYRVPLFEELNRELHNRGHVLELWAAEGTKELRARNDSTCQLAFQTLVREYSVPILGKRIRLKPAAFRATRADLVVNELGSLVLENYWLAAFARRFAGWGHGYAATTKPNVIDSALERWLMRKSGHFFAYTERGQAAAIDAGMSATHVTVLYNSTDVNSLRAAISDTSADEVQEFKVELGVPEYSTCAAYIGALDAPKRIPFLLEAARELRRRLPSFHLVVAGDGPDRAVVQRASDAADWIHFVGRAGNREKALIASTCSVLLNPGRVGLIAVDSLAMGTPVVTTTYRDHGPEIAYLEQDRTFLQTENTMSSYVNGALWLLTNDVRISELRSAARAASDTFSTEAMAMRFADGIDSALKVRTRFSTSPLLRQ